MKTGISIKHGNGVSIYGDEKGLAEALSQGTPLPLTEEQQDAFGEFFELQTAKLREEANVETPMAPLPTDIIGMRGDLNRVVPAGFIMLYNKLDEIQKESSQSNGGGFLGFPGGGGSSPGITAAESEALQQAAAAAVAASQSAQQSQVAATEAQQAAQAAQQAMAQAQAASNAEVTNPAVSRVSVPLDPFRINLNTGLTGTATTKAQTQVAETPDPFKVSLSLAGDSANSLKIAQVAADVDQFKVDLSSLQATDQQFGSQISALGTFDASIQSQVNDLSQSIQQNFGVINSTIQGLNATVSSLDARVDGIKIDLNSQIYNLSVKVASLSNPANLPAAAKTELAEVVVEAIAEPDFAATVSEEAQEVVAAITEGEATQTVEAVQEALEEAGLDAETIAVVEEVVEAATTVAEEATAGTNLNTEEARGELIKQAFEKNLKQARLQNGAVGTNLAGVLDRQNQTTISAPGSGTVGVFGAPGINPIAAQANPNFAQTAGQQFAIAPSQLAAGDYLPAGGGVGVSTTVLSAGVGMAM